MNKKSVKKMWGIVLTLAVMLCVLEAIPLQAGRICEDALMRCLDDPFNQAIGYIGTVYCGIGWAFCKKYIDPE